MQDQAEAPQGSQNAALSQTTVTNPPAPMPAPPKPTSLSTADAEATPRPIVKPPVTTLDKAQIVGADAADVRALIGTPETIVANAPSQTWFYAGGPCRFSLQFFKDLDSGNYRALKYDVEGGTLERCLAQFERLQDSAVVAELSEKVDIAPKTELNSEPAAGARGEPRLEQAAEPASLPARDIVSEPVVKGEMGQSAETAQSVSEDDLADPASAPLGAQSTATKDDTGSAMADPSG
ncbi:MAG: hypothetical protein AAF607_17465 [Pseudomonadota bacterium]